LELTISSDRMKDAAIYLANFPTVLVQTAARLFPKACSEDSPEDDDDGTPGYIVLERLEEFI
jgi:hypothetical protein